MTTTQNTVADRLAAIEEQALPWNQPCQCIRLNEPETVVVADSNDFYWLIAEVRNLLARNRAVGMSNELQKERIEVLTTELQRLADAEPAHRAAIRRVLSGGEVGE